MSVGRDSPEAIEAPETFEATDTFGIDVDNHGRDVRIHVALDDDLARVASLPENNHHVESDGSVTVPVEVHSERTHTGTLTVATGYGREDHAVTVTVTPEEPETPVEPTPSHQGATESDSGRSALAVVGDVLDGHRDTPVGLLALAGLAVVVALAAATTVGGVVGLAGGVVVLLGVTAAGWLVLGAE